MLSILGVQYRPVQDVFTYQVNCDLPTTWTKRSVLSTVARTFDPNGWVAPLIFWAKCFLQLLWTQGLSWDESLSGQNLQDWLFFYSSLPHINQVSLPRCFLPLGPYKASLHGFCDASERGYAAVVYLRTVSKEHGTSCHILMSKTKVSPLRTKLTVPKLELAGAALLTRLLNHLKTLLEKHLELGPSYAWTDSQIVLCWLRASPHTLETFVGNRVSQIQNSDVPILWRHVPGDLNPADVASRGCFAPELLNHPLWWGPEWLSRSESSWPATPTSILSDPLPGLRVAVMTKGDPVEPSFLISRYSSLNKLLGVTGWLYRFVRNCKNPDSKVLSPVLTSDERQRALSVCVRVVQAEHFESDLKTIKSGNSNLKGAIRRLNPFIDDSGLLRVGGRLRNSKLPYGARHPLLLPKSSPLTTLLIRDRHLNNSHAGLSALLATLQREFWILSARRAIRSVLFRCIPCYRRRPPLMQPPMGDLPADRVAECRPFSGVGTDFAGPFSIKATHYRGAKTWKAYLCVFVCLSTRAVHLEVVSALSTEAFLAAFQRFISRRGCPGLVRSDNGTNYVGANKHLSDLHNILTASDSDVSSFLARQRIRWEFSPPACPHWGGIFEAAVKSAKSLLLSVIGQSILTFEELTTVFTRVEAVLNSRPLCALSSDPNDLEPLTPGHFLIGQPLNALPERPYREPSESRQARFHLVNQLSQSFWRRFSAEYLNLLSQRVKWTDKSNPPKVGDLVLIKDSNLPPLCWRRGRILNLILGKDSIPRVCEVLVGDSVLKRAVTSLSRLPLD